jgi:capsid assembly protease
MTTMASRAYSRANILARLFNQPLAVMPQTAAIVLGAIGDRFDVSQLFVAVEGCSLALPELESLAAERRAELEASGGVDRRAKTWPAEKLMFVHNGVAHVGVRGETVAENGIGPMSGFTGYDGIVAQVQAADADPNVRGILLDIDSPGGEVAGLYECAAILMTRRGTKPMRAMIRGLGCSAAYALACCADEVTLHDLGYAGSIGTISMHADFSEALAAEGIKVTLFAAGAHKADGNPYEPLPPEVAKDIQAMVEIANSRFIAHVAAARGISADAVIAQQAQVFMGEAAVAAGLVDKIMSWQDSMDEFEAAVNGTGNRPAASTASSGARSAKGTSMSTDNPAPAAEQQPEFTQSQLDQAVAAARSEGVTAGATAERERLTALAELDAGTTLSAAFTEALTAGTSAGDFAIGLARASKAKAEGALGDLKADAVRAEALPGASPASAAGGNAPAVNRGEAAVARNRGKVPGLPATA